jgi:hypothetical protein
VDESTSYAFYALVVALLVPGGAALWKASSLRGDIFDTWNDRVDVTFAALSERAVNELLALQKEINDLLVESGLDEFDPLKVLVDPAMLSGHVDKYQQLMAARSKLKQRFRHLCRLGPIAIAVISTYLVGVIVATIHFGGLFARWWVSRIGVSLAVAAIIAGVVVMVDYAHLQQRLSLAEMLAEEDTE